MQDITQENQAIKATKDRHGENFPVGSLLIKRSLRPAIHAFYAFARYADDIADSNSIPAAEKIRRLDALAEAIRNEQPDAPVVAHNLNKSLREHGITSQHSLDLLVAFRRDATTTHTPDWEALLDYCRYSASPVGRHVLALHGIKEEAWPENDALCTVLQILNHLQDCALDLRNLNRVYIPDTIMAAHHSERNDLALAHCSPAMRGVLDDILNRCAKMLNEAAKFPDKITDKRLRCEVRVIITLATLLTARLRNGDPLAKRVKLRWWDFGRAFARAVFAG